MNYSKYMDLTQEVKQVEKELVELIIEHLKINRIAVETARQQAKDFLGLLPIKDQKDLLSKLKNLGERYEEAKEVYAEELGKINEAMRQQTLNQMREYIQAGNIDGAIAAAKAMYPPKVDVPTEPSAVQEITEVPPSAVVPELPTISSSPETITQHSASTPSEQQVQNAPAEGVAASVQNVTTDDTILPIDQKGGQ